MLPSYHSSRFSYRTSIIAFYQLSLVQGHTTVHMLEVSSLLERQHIMQQKRWMRVLLLSKMLLELVIETMWMICWRRDVYWNERYCLGQWRRILRIGSLCMTTNVWYLGRSHSKRCEEIERGHNNSWNLMWKNGKWCIGRARELVDFGFRNKVRML